jgi:hypothetical protein
MANLALDELQTQLIHATANALSPAVRSQFLSSIIDRLEGRNYPPTNDEVMDAIAAVRALLCGDFDDCC